MTLTEAVRERRRHTRHQTGTTCVVCAERHPCRDWRLARAAVLIEMRRAFATTQPGEPR
jgi:hypothetical protein